jgi:hypothetical protein
MLCSKEPLRDGRSAEALFQRAAGESGQRLVFVVVATFGRNEATPLTYCCCSFRRSKSAISSGGKSCGASFRALSPRAIAACIACKIAVGLTACSLVSS